MSNTTKPRSLISLPQELIIQIFRDLLCVESTSTVSWEHEYERILDITEAAFKDTADEGAQTSEARRSDTIIFSKVFYNLWPDILRVNKDFNAVGEQILYKYNGWIKLIIDLPSAGFFQGSGHEAFLEYQPGAATRKLESNCIITCSFLEGTLLTKQHTRAARGRATQCFVGSGRLAWAFLVHNINGITTNHSFIAYNDTSIYMRPPEHSTLEIDGNELANARQRAMYQHVRDWIETYPLRLRGFDEVSLGRGLRFVNSSREELQEICNDRKYDAATVVTLQNDLLAILVAIREQVDRSVAEEDPQPGCREVVNLLLRLNHLTSVWFEWHLRKVHNGYDWYLRNNVVRPLAFGPPHEGVFVGASEEEFQMPVRLIERDLREAVAEVIEAYLRIQKPRMALHISRRLSSPWASMTGEHRKNLYRRYEADETYPFALLRGFAYVQLGFDYAAAEVIRRSIMTCRPHGLIWLAFPNISTVLDTLMPYVEGDLLNACPKTRRLLSEFARLDKQLQETVLFFMNNRAGPPPSQEEWEEMKERFFKKEYFADGLKKEDLVVDTFKNGAIDVEDVEVENALDEKIWVWP
ncbi:hypothetical protein MMC25_002653 [Agyrium rufum]|nr:hypothetical protein [Agyrium rufum]